jgi:hypothetical protein
MPYVKTIVEVLKDLYFLLYQTKLNITGYSSSLGSSRELRSSKRPSVVLSGTSCVDLWNHPFQ